MKTSHKPLRQLNVLVVEDSASERAILKARLESLGHTIHQAENGEQALSILGEQVNGVDLILLDVDMPVLNGYDTARQIRIRENSEGLEWQPIIFLSGMNEPEDIAEGINAGGDDFLIKPINKTILEAKITAMLRIADMRNRLLETQKQLEIQAHIDELTQIANRRYFFQLLDREIARSKRHGSPLCLAYFDIDHFKKVNDSRGHEGGDVVLKNISAMLRDSLRSEDAIGRLGGEEFCICLPELGLEEGVTTCERFRKQIEACIHESNGERFNVTASFGLTQFNPQQDNRDTLIARADELLYASKTGGRNRVTAA
jgi:two-component system cell cycle response regulator